MHGDKLVRLGPFVVDKAGRLNLLAPRTPIAFNFRWRARPMRACLRQTSEADGALTLLVQLGRVRSTATDRGAGSRSCGFALLRGLKLGLPAGWRVSLRADHCILLQMDDRFALPFTVTELLTRIACLMLALAPYLDLMDEIGALGLAGEGDPATV
jgi:hypothetical protein